MAGKEEGEGLKALVAELDGDELDYLLGKIAGIKRRK